MTHLGKAFIVGAGPGRPDLITLRGLDRLRRAEVLMYDRLVAAELIEEVDPACEKIFVGKRPGHHPQPQAIINEMLLGLVKQGKRVVRLKGGDPFVFGRGGEEALALAAAGLPFEIVPGISSATAVPAYAGVPLTAKGVSGSFTVLTGYEDPTKAESMLDWSLLSKRSTLVILMAVKKLPSISRNLISAGKSPDTPAIAISQGTTLGQTSVLGTLERLPRLVKEAALPTPAIVVIGESVNLAKHLGWFEPEGGAAVTPEAQETASPFQTASYPPPARVTLVGAGPGAPDLITVRGLKMIEMADIVLHDRLVHQALLANVKPGCQIINVGKSPKRARFPQSELNQVLVEAALSGQRVVRLKGGDPFIFGLGSSELEALNEVGIPYEVVPGLSSITAVPGNAGIPITHRGVSTSLTVLSGHQLTAVDWENLPQHSSLIILMGVKRLPQIVAQLQAQGIAGATPIGVIGSGTTEQEHMIVDRLDQILDRIEVGETVTPPSLIIVGEVVRLREKIGVALDKVVGRVDQMVWGNARA